MQKKYLWGGFLVVGLLTACKDKEPDLPANGVANFIKYVAVGNSFTAGYTDAGLYRDGQVASFPNLLAQQFKQVGGGDFLQPLFANGQESGSGYLKILGTSATGVPNLVEVKSSLAIRSTSPLLYTEFTGANQNLGVPGIRMADIDMAGFGASSANSNAFFERLLSANDKNKTYLAYVSENASTATFFTCWLGTNDLLTFAVSGGTRSMTDLLTFTNNCKAVLNTLTAKQAKGVVANLYDVTIAAYFNLVTLASVKGQNNATVYIKTGLGTVRAATDKDLILPVAANTVGIPNASGFPKGYFVNYPLDNNEVLDSEEIAQVQQNMTAYNAVIEAEVKARNLALMNANELFNKLKAGISQDNITLNTTFLTGGVFSLDGVHLTPRGNAWIANEFLNAINQTYQSRIPLLDVSKYDGVKVKP